MVAQAAQVEEAEAGQEEWTCRAMSTASVRTGQASSPKVCRPCSAYRTQADRETNRRATAQTHAAMHVRPPSLLPKP